MKSEKIIDTIVDKINAGYDNYGIERFLKHQEINPDEFETLIETAKNKILEHQLKTYPKQNKKTFIVWLSMFVVFLILLFILLPLLHISNGVMLLLFMGSVGLSFSGFNTLLYYKSWEKTFIERTGKPKFNLQTYILLASLPTVIFYYIISWNYLSGPGHDLYKMRTTFKLIKFFRH